MIFPAAISCLTYLPLVVSTQQTFSQGLELISSDIVHIKISVSILRYAVQSITKTITPGLLFHHFLFAYISRLERHINV